MNQAKGPLRRSHVGWYQNIVNKANAAEHGDGPGVTMEESLLLCLHNIQNRLHEISKVMQNLTITPQEPEDSEEENDAELPSSTTTRHRSGRGDSHAGGRGAGERRHPGSVSPDVGVARNRGDGAGRPTKLPTQRTRTD